MNHIPGIVNPSEKSARSFFKTLIILAFNWSVDVIDLFDLAGKFYQKHCLNLFLSPQTPSRGHFTRCDISRNWN